MTARGKEKATQEIKKDEMDYINFHFMCNLVKFGIGKKHSLYLLKMYSFSSRALIARRMCVYKMA